MQRLREVACAALVMTVVLGAVPSLTSAVGASVAVSASQAQPDTAKRLDDLAFRLRHLETRVDRNTGAALAFLFGAFCALWAQNTKRSAWAWFFIGMLFSIVAVLVLLAKNSDDLKAARGGAPARSGAPILAAVLGILLVIVMVMLLWSAG